MFCYSDESGCHLLKGINEIQFQISRVVVSSKENYIFRIALFEKYGKDIEISKCNLFPRLKRF